MFPLPDPDPPPAPGSTPSAQPEAAHRLLPGQDNRQSWADDAEAADIQSASASAATGLDLRAGSVGEGPPPGFEHVQPEQNGAEQLTRDLASVQARLSPPSLSIVGVRIARLCVLTSATGAHCRYQRGRSLMSQIRRWWMRGAELTSQRAWRATPCTRLQPASRTCRSAQNCSRHANSASLAVGPWANRLDHGHVQSSAPRCGATPFHYARHAD